MADDLLEVPEGARYADLLGGGGAAGVRGGHGRSPSVGADASAGANPRVLAAQLDQLVAELDRVQGQVEGAAPRLVTARAAAVALHALAPRRSGTPIETERLDVLDGIVIELVRQARAAARVAATITGNQALAQAYAIDDLLG